MNENKPTLEVKIGDRSYSLVCDPSSPCGETIDALMMMRDYVIGLIKSHDPKPIIEENKDG